MNEPVILIADDELQIRKMLQITLQSNGYSVSEAATGKECMVTAANHPPELILLDLGLPDQSGHDVLRQLREWYNKPIIILSVRNGEDDIVKALDAGANDYLVKPFRTGELLARMRAALKSTDSSQAVTTITCEEFEIDLVARLVRKKGEIIKLTVTEYALLLLLAKNEGRVLTHQYLLREIWGPGYVNQTQYLRVYIAQLRKKLENDPNRPLHIITEAGVGYRFMAA